MFLLILLRIVQLLTRGGKKFRKYYDKGSGYLVLGTGYRIFLPYTLYHNLDKPEPNRKMVMVFGRGSRYGEWSWLWAGKPRPNPKP
jgi:hypothetical protein